jgi:predicted ATP-dependent protease
MDDLLRCPNAWEALLRALRAGVSRIEDPGEEDGSKAKGLHPAPVPLSLKVILVGKEELYEMLLMLDDRFGKLFKIKAHLTDSMPRGSREVRIFLAHIRRVIDDDALLPFDREALAFLVDYGSHIIEDQRKLSLKYPRIREIMVEASASASMNAKPVVTREILRQSLDARAFRSNLVEEEFMEEYDQGIIKVSTSGLATGKVNGLSVTFYGDFEFGLPHRISCTVGAGSGGIIDLERDAQLGGPIHTKAMMILKSYLVGAFAHNKPLVLTGSLGFEQNYAGIEGDSASGAELAALLSALAGVPVRLNLAFTGAVGQDGEIMAVGGVTRKIEGFFKVCERRGLTGEQGVILPWDNIAHVLLRDELIEAISAGRFRIYAVRHITEAMEILTGLPSGRLRKDGTYTPGSLFRKVDERLKELTRLSSCRKRNS